MFDPPGYAGAVTPFPRPAPPQEARCFEKDRVKHGKQQVKHGDKPL